MVRMRIIARERERESKSKSRSRIEITKTYRRAERRTEREGRRA